MKKILLGAAALMAISAPAFADTTGYIGGTYSTSDDDSTDGYRALTGAVTTELSGAWNVTFGASSVELDHIDHAHGYGNTTVGAVYNGGTWAAGGHGGYLTADDNMNYNLGADGALLFDRFTLSGSIDWVQDAETDADEFWVTRASGTFYITDNVALGGTIAQYTDDNSGDMTTFGLNVEYKPEAMPVSFVLGYTDVDEDGGYDNNGIQLGVRWAFGTDTLKERGAATSSPELIATDLAIDY